MTSRITQDPAKGEKGFPRLMIHKDGDIVVLFQSPTEGVRVGGNYEYGEIGEYSTDWEPDEFTDFHGAVELRND